MHPVHGVDFPPTQYTQDATSQLNLAVTTPTQGSPDVAVYFLGPTSGRVLLVTGGSGRDNNATNANRVYLMPEVRENNEDGDIVLAASVSAAGFGTPPEAEEFYYGSRAVILEGLTTGLTYFARVLHMTDNGDGTADVGVRDILVEALP